MCCDSYFWEPLSSARTWSSWELGHHLRARRLREGRGDIRAMPFALFGGYGLPWPYAAIAFVVGTAALVVFIHG
jgi:hypothetical protein